MGFGKFIRAVVKAATTSQPSAPRKSSASGGLGFQETGTPPKRDTGGRIIVKVKGGTPGAAWGVNLSRLDSRLGNILAGKVNEDEEFNKSVKVHLRPDTKSEYSNSVLVETPNGEFIGWILKDASEDFVSVMSQLRNAVVSTVPELSGDEFVFEMSAKIEGHWDEVGDGDVEEWEANFDEMLIRMKNPAEIDVE
jgi:hypothetical protein